MPEDGSKYAKPAPRVVIIEKRRVFVMVPKHGGGATGLPAPDIVMVAAVKTAPLDAASSSE